RLLALHAPLFDPARALLAARQIAPARELADAIPPQERTGNYYLLDANLLAANGNIDEARAAAQHALDKGASDPELFRMAMSWMVDNDRAADAALFAEAALKAAPGNRDLMLLHAAALTRAGRSEDANNALTTLQNRW